MKAAYIEKTGPPEKIIYGSLPKPKPTGKQVLIKISAVAVNPVDTYLRSGMLEMDLPQPFILGCDFAGVVEAVGPEVTKYRKGDRVWGSNQGMFGRQGTFAEYAVVEECWVYPTPEEVSDEDAAAIAMVGLTAHLGLFREARLKTDEGVFVGGGAGGVGSCVIQMARIIGARVLAAAGNKRKVEICQELGATMVINYRTDDLEAALKKFGPVNVWFETRRDQDLERAINNVAVGGRIVVMAGGDTKVRFNLGSFYRKDCKLLGYAIFNTPPDEQRKAAAEINRWLGKGRLRARIDRVMKLSDAAAAHRLQEENTLGRAGTLAGKIVLIP